ncbi:MAG: hypothetical protein MI810_15690 [Flavobacteriales bacterium]|nr:hypothetical protein [Flavobacteriales bacterium]
MVSIELIDWGIWLVYLALISLILFFYRISREEEHYRFFLFGFSFKVLGGLAFALVYIYYYAGGDSIEYFKNSSVMVEAFMNSPGDYLSLMTSASSELPAELASYADRMGYSSGQEEWFMVRVLSVFNLFGFNSYLVTTLLVSLLSFWGSWKLFLVMGKRVQNKMWAFLAVFVTPSVVFWGSGILRDTVVTVALSIFIWSFYLIFFERRIRFVNFVILVLSGFFAYRTKSYVLILFLPAMALALFVLLRRGIRVAILRVLAGPLLVLMLGISGYLGIIYLSNASSKYELQGIEKKVKGFHSWHTFQGGSVYDLGEIEYTAIGVLSKVPAAVNVTLFRPYIWESNNIVMLLGALESLACLILFIRLLVIRYNSISFLVKDPFILMLLIYVIVLGFVVGFISFNFGALVRYKIPMLSMFTFILLALNFDSNYLKYNADKN